MYTPSCSAATHGGFFVDAERFAQMPPEYQALVFPCRADNGGAWFEEDCAWVAVVLSFPQEFEAYHRKELYEWQFVPRVPMRTRYFHHTYYMRRGVIFWDEERDWYIAYHTRQLTEMPARAQRIYQDWYINRQKEQS